MDTRAAGSLIIYSTQPNTAAVDGKGPPSPFAAALLRPADALTGNSPNDVALRNDVVDATGRQILWTIPR